MFSSKFRSKMFLVAAVLAFTGSITVNEAKAQTSRYGKTLSTKHISGAFNINVGETQTIPVTDTYYKAITVQADGLGGRESTIDVLVNGVVKGTIHVPGRDPSYIVTIEDNATSIEFRQTSGGGMHVSAVLASTKRVSYSSKEMRSMSMNFGSSYAEKIDDFYEGLAELRKTLPVTEYATYFQPVFSALVKLRIAVNAGHGPISPPVLDGWRDFIEAVTATEPKLEELTNWPDYETLAVDFRTMIAKVRRDLYN